MTACASAGERRDEGGGEGDARRACAVALKGLGDEASEGQLIKASLKELAR